MKILNLGCGTKTSASPQVVNIDWSVYLRLKRSRLAPVMAPLLLSGERLRRFRQLPDNILVHDLSRGIPFPADSVDVVYHSHVLEHLDRDVADRFLLEVRRVLRVGGTQRIVVPDLERLCRSYLADLEGVAEDQERGERHDTFVAEMLEQSVRRMAAGTAHQPPLKRFLETVLLGDARRRGETHQWMYDRVNLTATLRRLGFRGVHLESYDRSTIPDWTSYGLDLDEAGEEYKPGSLYVEARK